MKLTEHHIRDLSPPLYRFFLARFSAIVAEELVNEVFMRLMESAGNIDPSKGTLASFLWGIALNLQKEAYRGDKRFPKLLEVLPDHADSESPAIKFMALRQAINKLNETESIIMQLVLADNEISEISEILKMPEGTVKSHIHRAKKNIYQIMIERPSL
jgi:RNA polymerase sigma-70 factor, ECF subfamily